MYGIDFQEENLVSREGGTIKIILYPSNIYASTVEQVLVRHRGCLGRILGRFLNLIIREQKKEFEPENSLLYQTHFLNDVLWFYDTTRLSFRYSCKNYYLDTPITI